MALSPIKAGTPVQAMPMCLPTFERRRIAPGQRVTLAVAGQVALVFVIDGVLWRDDVGLML